jgi:hypothetical protein
MAAQSVVGECNTAYTRDCRDEEDKKRCRRERKKRTHSLKTNGREVRERERGKLWRRMEDEKQYLDTRKRWLLTVFDRGGCHGEIWSVNKMGRSVQ